jgi:CyaY protein
MSEIQSESQFNALVDQVLVAIEDALEASDADIEFETVSGILTLEFDNGSKIIINRQTPNREIWVAARSGGFHFRRNGETWADTRGGPPLAERLAACILDQCGESLRITL